VTAVRFGATPGKSVHVVSATRLYITSPPHAAGTVGVRVVTTHGASAGRTADHYTYVAPPAISAISPTSGPTAGGTRVALTGRNFRHVSAVRFGTTAAGTAVHVTSSTKLYVTAPAHAGALVNVRVTTAYGASAVLAADHYAYVAPPAISAVSPAGGPTTGGTRVAVSGSNFRHVAAVMFGTAAGTAVHVTSSTRLYVTAPAHAVGGVDVGVRTAYGTSRVVAADQFSYVVAPTISTVTPGIGTSAGGTTLTVTGTGFVNVTSVTFGGIPGTATVVNSATELTVQTPPHSAGSVDVQVTITYAISAVDTDAFTFE